jgi:hypothetical protein
MDEYMTRFHEGVLPFAAATKFQDDSYHHFLDLLV